MSRRFWPLCKQTSETSPLFIFFPGLASARTRPGNSNEAMQHMGERIASNLSGVLMYHPPGRALAMGKFLAIEFATELLESILAVFLLAQTRLVSFGTRVGFVCVGIVAALVLGKREPQTAA